MLIVGQISNREEAEEITSIIKLFLVGQRARILAQRSKILHDELKSEKVK